MLTVERESGPVEERLGPERGHGLRERIGLFLGPVLFVAVSFVLQANGITSRAAWAGGTVAFMACWWITEPVPLWTTALLPLVIFPLTGSASLVGTLLQYLDPINFLFLGGMWIAASMQQWGLHRRLALGIVAKIGASPRRIVFGFMLGTGFITLWISNTATAMMMFPIALAVLKKFEEQHGAEDPLVRRFGLALMLGLAYAASIGGVGSKIGTGTNLVFVKHAAEAVPEGIGFVTWMKLGMPVVILALPLVWLYLVRVAVKLPAEEFPGGRDVITRSRTALGVMNGGEKVALAAFLAAAFLWIFRKDIELGTFTIPGWWNYLPFGWEDFLGRPVTALPEPLPGLLKDVGDGAVAMGVALVLFVVPVRQGGVSKPALDFAHARGIAWGMLLLLGGGFAMAYGIQQSGLSDAIASSLGNVGKLQPLIAVVMVAFASVGLTEVASNTATASIMLPLLAGSADGFGLHPAPMMLAATLASSFGFMLPAGTPPNAIAFSSGYISVPQMVRCGLVVDIAGAALIGVYCYFMVPLVLGLP